MPTSDHRSIRRYEPYKLTNYKRRVFSSNDVNQLENNFGRIFQDGRRNHALSRDKVWRSSSNIELRSCHYNNGSGRFLQDRLKEPVVPDNMFRSRSTTEIRTCHNNNFTAESCSRYNANTKTATNKNRLSSIPSRFPVPDIRRVLSTNDIHAVQGIPWMGEQHNRKQSNNFLQVAETTVDERKAPNQRPRQQLQTHNDKRRYSFPLNIPLASYIKTDDF